MQDENREEQTPVPGTEPTAPPVQPPAEPEEVVSWYVRPDRAREVQDCYVQPRPMPAAAIPKAEPEKKPHSRRGLWIFLIVLAVLVGTVLGVAIPRADIDPSVRFYCQDAAEEKLTIQQVYAAVNPATVLVVAEMGEKASIGTGVILTEDGYIVTNAHVIADGQSVLVALADARQYEAELVGFDSAEDLAVLKAVDAADLPTAVLGDSDECWVGDTVYAIGNPLGVELRGTLTQGIISAIDRRVTMDGKAMTMLQTTAALNNGNSGGPLINEYGQVIGINTMKMSNSFADAEAATVEGLGFAVPTGRAVTVINDILATGAFHGIPSIGVYVAEEQQPDGTYRPVIDSVTENFGAEAAGLQRGDVILSADGTAVYSNYDLLRARRAHIVGETITLTVQRDGQTLDVEVYLYPVVEE